MHWLEILFDTALRGLVYSLLDCSFICIGGVQINSANRLGTNATLGLFAPNYHCIRSDRRAAGHTGSDREVMRTWGNGTDRVRCMGGYTCLCCSNCKRCWI